MPSLHNVQPLSPSFHRVRRQAILKKGLDGRPLLVSIVVGNETDKAAFVPNQRPTRLVLVPKTDIYRSFASLTSYITNTYWECQFGGGIRGLGRRSSWHSLGPPNTRMSSDELPPLSLIGMMYLNGRPRFATILSNTSTRKLAAVPPEKTAMPPMSLGRRGVG